MNHEINLTGYTATCGEPNNMLDLGTAGSYGLEKLHVTADAAWNGLTITATFTNSGSTTVAVSDGAVDVPPEATRLPTRDRVRYGMLAFKGVDAQGKLRIISTPIYYKVQASAATDGSNTIDPTPDQYAQFVAEVMAEADRAEAAADRAESAGGNVTPEQIAEAVNNYLNENPVQATPIDATLTQSGQAADAKVVGDALGNLSEEIANLPGASGSGAGWNTEEIALLEIILGKAVYSADQTNNIEALIALLKSTSSGSEGSGGTTYTITLNLDGVTPSNMSASVSSGSVYVNQLEPTGDGYVLGSVTITMGGYDVTNKYYDGEGNITITRVSGDVVIACKALICETLNMVGLGSGKVDYTTFGYSVSEYGQYNLAEESETTGGYLGITWDTDSIDGAPKIALFLFKDGEPYKIGKASINAIDGADLVEVDCDLTYRLYWIDAGIDYGTPLKSISAPCKVQIPDGCTVMCMFNRGSLNNDEVSSNATFGAWVAAGGLTVTKVEGE